MLTRISSILTPIITTTLLLIVGFGCKIESKVDRECNGHPDLCNRAFNEVALPATHNSMSNTEGEWLAPNQQYGLTQQLQDGIRGLLLDTHDWQGQLYLCHGNCLFGKLLLVDGLREIATFLDDNPNEVISIIFQDGISNEQTAKAIEESGLESFLYTHDANAGWPLLNEMIDRNQRLLISAEFGGGTPAWYLHTWDIYHDTPYSFSSTEEFNCDHSRGSPDNSLFLVNHWVHNPLPDEARSIIVNSTNILGERVYECMEETGSFPNMVAVDFYAVGDLFSVVNQLNNVP